MNKQKTLIFSLSVILFLALSFIVYSWKEPTTAMPSGYTAPLNTSSNFQEKYGPLIFPMMYDGDTCDDPSTGNCPYYINPSGDSIVSGTITAANPTEDSHVATKEYVDSNGGSPAISKYFGSGMDGDVTISTNTTLAKDMEYKNLTIKSGAILNPNGWRVFVSNTLTIESGGKISRDGNNSDGNMGAVGLATNRVGGSGSGGMGQDSDFKRTGSNCVGSDGEFGAGGKGGECPGCGCRAFSGGNGGNNIILKEYIDPPSQSHLAFLPSLELAKFGGGGGGGGCAYEDGYGTNAIAGGGGSGGGIIHIFVKNIVNNGTISAQGGNGGNGYYESAGFSCAASTAGGGGGGGYILLVYNTKNGTGNLNVSGGIGGTITGTGTRNCSGVLDNSNGSDGSPGIINEYQVNF